jgi:hypothetical protein
MQNTQALQSGITGQELSAASGLAGIGQAETGNQLGALGTYGSGLSSFLEGINDNQYLNQQTATNNQNSNLGLFSSLLGGLFGL